MAACSPKAAPTTRRRIARRFEESRNAIARITTIPARLIRMFDILRPPPFWSLPDHLSFPRPGGAVQLVDDIADRIGDEQLGAARRRHEAAVGDMVEEVDHPV